jgi:branched-chain amino acid transport system substrate-binding protein
MILARDDPTSREMAEGTREFVAKQGIRTGDIEIYGSGTLDFAPQVTKAMAAGAVAWIAFGDVRDTAGMVRTFKKLAYAPPLFFARSASDPRLISLVGQDAEFAMGAREYDASFNTAGNDKFAAAFAAKYSTPPGPAAGEGYAAGTVLAEAVRRAGALDQDKLRATLAQLEIATVLGGYKVDPENGEQIAAKAAVVQILKGRAQIVWPENLQTAKPEPYAPWGERRVLNR